MAMTHQIEPQLKPVAIKDLRPTQMTIGLHEVEAKRAEWRSRAGEDGPRFLGRHMIPVVIGPRHRHWLIDHHHLARALHDEGVEHILVTVVAQLQHLGKQQFLSFMDCRNWLHPYDAEGKRHDWDDIPHKVGELIDDPWRSLAGAARQNGGFAKTETPYSEFLWADFFRKHFTAKQISKQFALTVEEATSLARSPAAEYLPGFSGKTQDEESATESDD